MATPFNFKNPFRFCYTFSQFTVVSFQVAGRDVNASIVFVLFLYFCALASLFIPC